jgi:flagellum-specific ATP synthase
MPLRAAPPIASQRARLGEQVDLGVAALSLFVPVREGQRVGVFSGSGVGKSSLLSMIARHTACDVNVIALIGERGREVREFVEDSLGEAGLARSVVIVATSDEAAILRREAAFLALTVAEYFRDEGDHVLCLVDSLTRIATAQREIGLAAGEPPTTKGYTPSVFSLLPKLLERAGPGRDQQAGAVTGVFSVLVEGDDADEPVADAARALLDGHIVLSRKIAERGRFPAIDILKSISRTASSVQSARDARLVEKARRYASLYDDMREMIAIGAYRRGSDADTDRSIIFHTALEELLTQQPEKVMRHAEAFAALGALTAETEGQ